MVLEPAVGLDVAPSEQPRGATTAEISTTFRGSKARFGVTVTFTVQLQDSNGNDVSVGLDGQRPAEWTLTEELLEDLTVDGDPDTQSAVKVKNTRTVRSDSSGQVRFSVSEQRSSACAANSCTRTFKLTELSNAPAVAVNRDLVKRSVGRADGDVYYLEFSSVAPILADSVVRLTVPNPYIVVPDRGTVNNTATVTVHNEYGEALSAATASLASDKETSLTGQRFTIGRDGLHRFNYRYDGLSAEVEELTVTVDPDGNTTTNNNLAATDDRPLKAYMFWSYLTDDFDSAGAFTILFGDLDRDEIIVDTANITTGWPTGVTPELVEYDDNDRFDIEGTSTAQPRPVNSIDAFEKALAEFLAVTPDSSRGTGACLEWSNFGRERDTANIRLWRLGAGETCANITT